MNKKQKKVLKRILLAVLCIGVLHFLPVDGTLKFLLYMIPYLIIGFLVMSIMKPDNVLPVALFAIALVLIDFMRDKEAKTTSVVTGGEDDGEGI
mgnify:CR=1 FL=1